MKLIKRIKRWPKWLKITLSSLIVLLIAFRLMLPYIVKAYVNKTINGLDGYSGYVEDIDIALIRGAYVIKGTHIYSDDMGTKIPILQCKAIDLSVQWEALFDGRIVGEVVFDRLVVNFENKKTQKENNFEEVDPKDWRQTLRDLIPLKINFIEFDDCEMHFIDMSTSPKVDVFVSKINGKISNLTNKQEKGGTMIASYNISALAMNSAPIKFFGKFDPYDKKVTLDANFEMRGLPIPKTNDYLMAYTYTDAEKGTLDFFVELAVKRGKCTGYLKPLIKDLKLAKIGKDPFPNIIWQAIVGGVSHLIENWKHDQVATKIPLEGDISGPNIKVWPMIRELFRNMLIQALKSNLDGDVGLSSVNFSDPTKTKKEIRQEKRAERKAARKTKK